MKEMQSDVNKVGAGVRDLFKDMSHSGFKLLKKIPGSLRDFPSEFDLLSHLVRDNYFRVNAVNNQGESLLYWICRNVSCANLIEIVKKLCHKGANVNFVHPKDDTNSLFALVFNKELSKKYPTDIADIVFFLTIQGIDINKKDAKGCNILTYLCERMSDFDHYSETRIKFTLIRHLVEKGIDVNVTTQEGENILMLLAHNYQSRFSHLIVELVPILIARGINLKQVSNYLHCNVLNSLCKYDGYCDDNFLQLVKIFLDQGVDVNNKTLTGDNVLSDFLCFTRSMNSQAFYVVSLFIEHGVDLKSTNRSGENPLHVLCTREDLSLNEIFAMASYLMQNCKEKDLGDNPLLQFLTNRILDRANFDQTNGISFSVMTQSDAISFYRIIDLLVKLNSAPIRRKELAIAYSIVCRYYTGFNILDILRLLKHTALLSTPDSAIE